MSRSLVYVCQECGHEEPKWLGRCPACRAWSGLVEENRSGPAAAFVAPDAARAQPLEALDARSLPRLGTGLEELDRVLGGGLVPGSLVLIGGDPGVGKSTLMLQAAAGLASTGGVLYATGEESAAQLKLRTVRLGLACHGIHAMAATSIEAVLAECERLKPRVLILDSVQTFHASRLPAAPGSVGQIRELTGQVLVHAKRTGLAVFLVGHVTKDGSIAGPRTLEHMVDVVVYFEGEGLRAHRLVRSLKNRFGAAGELGLFEMGEDGLRGVANPSALFLSERPDAAAGSAVHCSLEGSRPLLVEIQALVSPSNAAMPRRTVTGFDPSRMAVLLAVIERHVGLAFGEVTLNVVGGISLREPAADLAVACAMASAARDVPLASRHVVFGEVGLAGEVRAVPRPGDRLREARQLGYLDAVVPASDAASGSGASDLRVTPVHSVQQALDRLLP